MNRSERFFNATGLTFLPSKNTVDYQLEYGLLHFPYEKEKEIYACFATGNVEKFDELMKEIREAGITIGPMASRQDRSLQYAMAVATAIVCRYCIEGGMLQQEAYSRCDEIVRSMDETSDVLTTGQWQIFLGKLRNLILRMQEIRASVAVRPEIRRACNYCMGHLHMHITVTQMAEEAGLSVSYFKALFKREIGISPGDYIQRQKIQYACQLLSSAGNSIAQIAYTLGFCSQSHFTRIFHQEIGMTPSRYRKELYPHAVDDGKG